MKLPPEYVEKLKWSIYEWIGAISVTELASNRILQDHVEALLKKLASRTVLECT